MANIKPGRVSVEGLRHLGTWTQKLRWFLQFDSMPAIAAGYDGNRLNALAMSMTAPGITTALNPIDLKGNVVYGTGKGEYTQDITITLVETTDFYVSSFIAAWREGHWETRNGSTGKSRLVSDLVCDISLYLLDNQDIPKMRYAMKACLLSDGKGPQDVGGDAEPHNPEMTITYHYFDEVFL